MFTGFGGFPFPPAFDDFEFGGFSHRRPRRNPPTFKHYDTLGVSRDATPTQIRKAFNQLAMRVHPDKGGDPEKFREIREAYEVLKDERKRSRYDHVGDEGVLEGLDMPSEGSGTVDDLFDELMGLCRNGPMGSSRGRTPGTKQKSKNMVHSIHVSLEDIYNGASRRLPFVRKRSCAQCKGTGFKGAVRHSCQECHGRGVKVMVMRYAHVIQEIQNTCDICGGSGLDSNPIYYCKTCCGAGEVEENKTLDVYIEQGMHENHKITYSGEASCGNPLMQPGDVVVTVRSEKHTRFARRNSDLLLRKRISLCDSLCGVDFAVKHLDERQLQIRTQPGEIIRPGQVKCIIGEGLPVHGQPSLKGNLYISFEVEYPESFTSQQQAAIRSVLGHRPVSLPNSKADDDDVPDMRDVHDLEEELREREQFGRQNGMSYESDDSMDQGHPHRRMQCSQQ